MTASPRGKPWGAAAPEVFLTHSNEHPKVFIFRCSAILDFRPHPYRMRPEIKGLSHGLKNSPPDCFSPRLRRGRPFESHPAYKKNRYPGWDNGFSGTPEGTRTPDLLIRSQSLYPTELPAHFALLS